MLIEISYGEGLDRLSILEIKVSKIKDKEKLLHINKEIETLNDLIVMKQKYNYYYELLFMLGFSAIGYNGYYLFISNE